MPLEATELATVHPPEPPKAAKTAKIAIPGWGWDLAALTSLSSSAVFDETADSPT